MTPECAQDAADKRAAEIDDAVREGFMARWGRADYAKQSMRTAILLSVTLYSEQAAILTAWRRNHPATS